MELSNFELYESIYFKVGDKLFDMHNDFEFEFYEYNQFDKTAVLEWTKGKGDWVPVDSPEKIRLYIDGISKFEVSEGRPDAPPEDSKVLDEIAYITDDEWCDAPFTTEQSPEAHWDYVIIFESDLWLQINGREMSVRVTP